jgi:glycosyltransferase involved in cell wall biosynthesis
MSRIVVLTPWDRMWSLAGGGAPSWAYLIEGMLAAGHRVDVLAAPGETHDYPDHQRTHRLVAEAWAYSRAYGHPDLVYGFSALATPAAAICGTAWRRPSVGKLFGTFLLPAVGHPVRLQERWDEALGFRAPLTRLVVHVDGTGGDIVARWLRVPAERLCFWRNGVDRAACDAARAAADPVAVRAEFGLAPDTPLIYTASRLVNWKRVDRIVRAMPGVLERQPSARLVIGGDGEERNGLQRLTVDLGVERAVIFAGSIPRERNLRLMVSANVFTATYDYSNLGNALQEAMSCGAPVVVTDTGRTRELVADGTAGLVVGPNDVRALAAALASVLDDLALRERLASGALHAAKTRLPSKEERIGWEVAMVERLIDAQRSA